MRRTEALQGVRMAVFLNVLNRWESAELNQAEALARRLYLRMRHQYLRILL